MASTTLPAQYFVEFDRISRNRSPLPLLVQADDLDALAEVIHRHADQQTMSRSIDVIVKDGNVSILAGLNSAGTGTYRKVATLCRDENCGVCDYPETTSVVPMAEGDDSIFPELLAVYCRRCGSFGQVGTEGGAR